MRPEGSLSACDNDGWLCGAGGRRRRGDGSKACCLNLTCVNLVSQIIPIRLLASQRAGGPPQGWRRMNPKFDNRLTLAEPRPHFWPTMAARGSRNEGEVTRLKRARDAEEEAALEELVFGAASSGARDELVVGRRQAAPAEAAWQDDEDEESDSDEAPVAEDDSEEDAEPAAKRVAWVDEDDSSLTIDLGSVNRLRKLRTDADETAIDGDEYQARLRSR
jgi:hypothetical protein